MIPFPNRRLDFPDVRPPGPLAEAPQGANPGLGIQIDFQFGFGENHGGDIPAFGHQVHGSGDSPQLAVHRMTHRRQ